MYVEIFYAYMLISAELLVVASVRISKSNEQCPKAISVMQ